MPNPCYFEIPVEDMPRAQGFYSALFDWRFEKMTDGSPAAEACDYWAIHTNSPDEPGMTMGGIMRKQSPEHKAIQYIAVEDLDASVQKVQDLGGMIVMPKTPVPGKGYFAIALDPDKNAFGLWTCDESATMPLT